MTIKDALEILDKSHPFVVWEIDHLFDDIRLSGAVDNDKLENDGRLVYYWLYHWTCTDTKVGYQAYFFDGKIVAIAQQIGRKMDKNIFWVGSDEYQTVLSYILSILKLPSDDVSYMRDEDWNFDITNDGFSKI